MLFERGNGSLGWTSYSALPRPLHLPTCNRASLAIFPGPLCLFPWICENWLHGFIRVAWDLCYRMSKCTLTECQGEKMRVKLASRQLCRSCGGHRPDAGSLCPLYIEAGGVHHWKTRYIFLMLLQSSRFILIV